MPWLRARMTASTRSSRPSYPTIDAAVPTQIPSSGRPRLFYIGRSAGDIGVDDCFGDRFG